MLEGNPRADIDDQVLFVEMVGILAWMVCGVSMVAGRLLDCQFVHPAEARWSRKVFGAPAAFIAPMAAIVQWVRGDHLAAVVSATVALAALGDLWFIYRVERAVDAMDPPNAPSDHESGSPGRDEDR